MSNYVSCKKPGQKSKGMTKNTEDPVSTGQPPDTNQQWNRLEVFA